MGVHQRQRPGGPTMLSHSKPNGVLGRRHRRGAPSSMELFLIRGGEVGRTEALRPVRFSSGTLPYSWCVMRSHRVAPLVLGSV
jgi:hypothetical protein